MCRRTLTASLHPYSKRNTKNRSTVQVGHFLIQIHKVNCKKLDESARAIFPKIIGLNLSTATH
jgi:hypothetical protein